MNHVVPPEGRSLNQERLPAVLVERGPEGAAEVGDGRRAALAGQGYLRRGDRLHATHARGVGVAPHGPVEDQVAVRKLDHVHRGGKVWAGAGRPLLYTRAGARWAPGIYFGRNFDSEVKPRNLDSRVKTRP